MDRSIMPAIGGYVLAGISALVGIMTPVMMYDILQEGKLLNAVIVLPIGFGFAYYGVKESIKENRETNRERKRQWAENPAKAAKHRRRRLLGIGLLVLVGVFDITVVGAPIIRESVTIGGFLLIASMLSVNRSAARRFSLVSEIKANL